MSSSTWKKINFLIFPIKPSIIMGNFLSVGSQSWLSSSNLDVFSLGFFFVYFVQNKPSNLPFISLMLWVEVSLGFFFTREEMKLIYFQLKLVVVLFLFFTFLNFEHSSESIQQLLRHSTQFSWSIYSCVNTCMVLLWKIRSSREPLFIILHC